MVQNKGKKSFSGQVATAGGGDKVQSDAAALAEFDQSAFAGLRQKIEQRLNDQNQGRKDKPKVKSKASAKDSGDTGGSGAKAKLQHRNDSSKGKKRDRNGAVIVPVNNTQTRDGRKKSLPDSNDKDDRDAVLRREILAFGGDAEDFDLVAGVESESEPDVGSADFSAPKPKNKASESALRHELAKMLEDAGQFVPEDIQDDELDADTEDELEDGNESDEDTVPKPSGYIASNMAKNAQEAAQAQAGLVLPKAFSKLVSQGFYSSIGYLCCY